MSTKTIKGSLKTCFFVLLFNFLFSMVAFFLIWYWAIPNVCIIVPALETQLESLDDTKLALCTDIVSAIGACLAIFPTGTFAYRISKQKKKDFFAYSKGRISYTDGIKFHFRKYGSSDILCLSCVIVLLTLLYAFVGDIVVIRVFPVAFWMFEYLGVLLGCLATIVFTGLSMLYGVFSAQKKWRAEYFIGE